MGVSRTSSCRIAAQSRSRRWAGRWNRSPNGSRQLRFESLENRHLLAADLIANGIRVSDASVDPGQGVTVNWTARNVGNSATGFFPLGASQQGVMWSSDNIISTNDTLLEREFLGWLDDGSTSPEAHGVTIPANAVPGRSYWIGVIADYDGDIGESNEGNNNDGAPVKVTINQADLIVNDIEMERQSSLPNVRPGDSVRLDFQVENQGTAPTIRDVHMRWYWGTTQDSTANFIAEGSLGSINGLSPGETEGETDASWTIPSLLPGQYWLTGVIDWDGRVSESNEGNNSRSEPYTVLPGRLTWRTGDASDASIVTTIGAGQTVWARIDGDPGQSFVIEVWEDDGALGDDKVFAFSTTVGPGGFGTYEWTVPWQGDDGDDPQNALYLFQNAFGPNNLESFLIEVTMGSAPVADSFSTPLTYDWGGMGPQEGVIDVTLKRLDSPEPIDPSMRTWIVTHGRNGSFGKSTDRVKQLADQIVGVREGDQVLTLDWTEGASFVSLGNFTDFSQEAWILAVANWAERTLTNYGFTSSNVNLVGHSFGAVISGELAAAFPGGVNTLLAIDPAEDPLVAASGSNYSTDNVVFGGDNSGYAWSFYTPGVAGNEETPTTADEAIVVTESEHSRLVDLVSSMIASPVGVVSRFFSLDRLLAYAPGPWEPDKYLANGNLVFGDGSYEAVILSTNNGVKPVSINYQNNDGFPVPAPGDYNQDNVVTGADFLRWQRALGNSGPNLPEDGNLTQTVDRGDLDVWSANFGPLSPAALSAVVEAPGVAAPSANVSLLADISSLALQRFNDDNREPLETRVADAVFEMRFQAQVGQPLNAIEPGNREPVSREIAEEAIFASAEEDDEQANQQRLTDGLLEQVFR